MPAGRPRKHVDVEELKKVAALQLSDEMLGAHFGVSHQTIRRNFGQIVDDARLNGKSKLIHTLWARAIGQGTKAGSDRLLEHALNRYVGPILQKIDLTTSEIVSLAEKALAADDAGKDE